MILFMNTLASTSWLWMVLVAHTHAHTHVFIHMKCIGWNTNDTNTNKRHLHTHTELRRSHHKAYTLKRIEAYIVVGCAFSFRSRFLLSISRDRIHLNQMELATIHPTHGLLFVDISVRCSVHFIPLIKCFYSHH